MSKSYEDTFPRAVIVEERDDRLKDGFAATGTIYVTVNIEGSMFMKTVNPAHTVCAL